MKTWKIHGDVPRGEISISGDTLESAIQTNMETVLAVLLPGEYAKRVPGSRYAAQHSGEPDVSSVLSAKISGMEYTEGILGGKGGMVVSLLVDTGGRFGPQVKTVWVYTDEDGEPLDNRSPQQRYEQKTIVTASLRLNRTTDADILAWLDENDGGNRQGFIKSLIREAMKKA